MAYNIAQTLPVNQSSDHNIPVGNQGLLTSHAYLGTILFCFGLWWWIKSLKNCYSSFTIDSDHVSSDNYGSGCCKNQLGEGVVKVILCIIGFGVEAMTLEKGRHQEYVHFPFFATFLLAGLLDLLMATIIAPPYGMNYVAHALPFFSQTYCLRAQAYDQPLVTNSCRLLTSYWGFITALTIVGEMLMKNSLNWAWFKCFAVIFQGIWLWQSALIVNPVFGEPWEENNHDRIMYVAVLFAWHLFFTLIIQLIILLIVAKCDRVSSTYTNELNLITDSHIDESSSEKKNIRGHVLYEKIMISDFNEEL